MKNLLIVFCSLILGVTVAKAQYLLDFGPGSPAWCMQQQQQMWMMNMQMAAVQQQQAEAVANFVKNQMNNMPGLQMPSNGYYMAAVDNGGGYQSSTEPCINCDGGYNTRKVYMGNGHVSEVKSRCSICHGKGYISR